MIKRMVPALCAAVLLTGVPAIAQAEDPDAPLECSGKLHTSKQVVLQYGAKWTYTHKVSWCVVNRGIVAVRQTVGHQEHDDTCVWGGNRAEGDTPLGDARVIFNMGEFLCRDNGEAAPRAVNPWTEVVIHPDGSSTENGRGIKE